MISRTEVYSHMYEHEKASMAKLLKMAASVPEPSRADPRFQQLVTLMDHIAACRHNWLDRFRGGKNPRPWWNKKATLESQAELHRKVESDWTEFLAGLDDSSVNVDFEYYRGKAHCRWNIEGQILQLIGHGNYHRGQIVLLIDQLGGRTVDTDYLFWAIKQSDHWGEIGG